MVGAKSPLPLGTLVQLGLWFWAEEGWSLVGLVGCALAKTLPLLEDPQEELAPSLFLSHPPFYPDFTGFQFSPESEMAQNHFPAGWAVPCSRMGPAYSPLWI